MQKIKFVVLFLYLSSCGNQTAPSSTNDSAAVSTESVPTRVDPGQVTLQFLHWYQTHYAVLSALPLVNQPADTTAFYSVNESATKQYLAQLQASQRVSPAYLTYWKQYFQKAGQSFQSHPQNEGPPEGFEYDLILQSQEIDEKQLTQARVRQQRIDGIQAKVIVQFPSRQRLRFSLQNYPNGWLIDRIEALSE